MAEWNKFSNVKTSGRNRCRLSPYLCNDIVFRRADVWIGDSYDIGSPGAECCFIINCSFTFDNIYILYNGEEWKLVMKYHYGRNDSKYYGRAYYDYNDHQCTMTIDDKVRIDNAVRRFLNRK